MLERALTQESFVLGLLLFLHDKTCGLLFEAIGENYFLRSQFALSLVLHTDRVFDHLDKDEHLHHGGHSEQIVVDLQTEK